ncbi:MAG: hypothetical protein IIT57_07920 [Treponema sp.]|nr:hypothetical protein [Treponema sp.]
MPRFQPTFQCFRTLFCYIAFPVYCTYLLQLLDEETDDAGCFYIKIIC